jgi:hypothetical protein
MTRPILHIISVLNIIDKILIAHMKNEKIFGRMPRPNEK